MTQPASEPGLPCPNCNELIRFTIEALLTRTDFFCSACGLKLSLNRPESQESLQVLEKINEAAENVEKVKRQWE